MAAMHIFDIHAVLLLFVVESRKRISENLLVTFVQWFCLHPDDEA
jgi:hypothetical protein